MDCRSRWTAVRRLSAISLQFRSLVLLPLVRQGRHTRLPPRVERVQLLQPCTPRSRLARQRFQPLRQQRASLSYTLVSHLPSKASGRRRKRSASSPRTCRRSTNLARTSILVAPLIEPLLAFSASASCAEYDLVEMTFISSQSNPERWCSRRPTPPWIVDGMRWWRLWSVGRSVFAIILLAGVSLMVAGYGQYGAWLVAVTSSLVILSWTGLFRTRYQRSVVQALQPIEHSRIRRLEERLELSAELRRLDRLTAPAVLRSVHEEVSQVMREVSDWRWRLMARDMLRYLTSSISRRKRLNSWRKFDTEPYRSDKQVVEYLTALKSAVLDFEAKQRVLTEQNKKDTETVIANLRGIMPPKSRAVAHYALIDDLVSISILVTRQRVYIQNYDETNMTRAACELVEVSAKMRSAIRKLRHW
jgi:hypothetical protein